MTAWNIRHEGSPRSIEGLTLQQVLEGLQDGRWEATDEVMGPHDRDWITIENHPELAEVAAELEPPPPRVYDDETRLDMNALIDVTLVLLIFFILTTTYASLQKIIDAASATAERPGDKIRQVDSDEVEESMIKVEARTVEKDGMARTVLKVQGKEVAPEDLQTELRKHVGGQRRKVLLDHDPKVPHGVIVAIQDDARSAGVSDVLFLIP